MPAQLYHDLVHDSNWAVQHIVLWVATCSACLHLLGEREWQQGAMFGNWELAIWGGISGPGQCDHGDQAHALFALWSAASHHKAISLSPAWSLGKLLSLIATIPCLSNSGKNNCQLFSFGGAICKILSSLWQHDRSMWCSFVSFFINTENNNLFYRKWQ